MELDKFEVYSTEPAESETALLHNKTIRDFTNEVVVNSSDGSLVNIRDSIKPFGVEVEQIDCIETSQCPEECKNRSEERDPLSDLDEVHADEATAAADVATAEADRGDGSDSGLGGDTTEPSQPPAASTPPPGTAGTGGRSISGLKRRAGSETDERTFDDIVKRRCAPTRSSLKRAAAEPDAKRMKKSIRFEDVTVYYFPRAQGFTCVPSAGGSTLGMERRHSHAQRFSLAEHAAEQRRLHRQLLQQLRNERLQRAAHSSSEDSDSDSDTADLSDSELELDGYYFLQPVGARARRALLRAAGVRRVEPHEKDECRDIRASREFCGCACQNYCDPESCSCSLAGIKCQVDRLSFPCACARDACGNTAGRVEFNPLRVQTHFVHTLVRLGVELARDAPPPPPPPPPPAHTYPASSFEDFAHPTHVSMFSHHYPPHAYADRTQAAPALPPLPPPPYAVSYEPVPCRSSDENWFSREASATLAAASSAAAEGGSAQLGCLHTTDVRSGVARQK